MSIFKRLIQKLVAQTPVAKEPTARLSPPYITSQEEEEPHEYDVVLPRIKANYSHEIYRNDTGRGFKVNQIPTPLQPDEEETLILQELYADLLLSFAIDVGTEYHILHNSVLKLKPDLTKDRLKRMSINALIREIEGNVEIQGDTDHVIMVTAGGNFEAALILLDYFWEQIHETVGQELIIANPAKDLLFICAR